MKRYVTKYWFAGMKKPKTLPKGCEVLTDSQTMFIKEEQHPDDWVKNVRRWRVPVKTCKWYEHETNNDIIINLHTGQLWHINHVKFCPTCGKPVEIVEKKERKK